MIFSKEKNISTLTDAYNEKILSFNYSKLSDNDLFKGKLGVIHYLLSFYEHSQDDIYLDKISELLENILSDIQNNTKKNLLNDSTLLSGAAGLGFILKDLLHQQLIDEEDFTEQTNIIDELIFENTLKFISEEYFDYLGGPIGNLQYFLSWDGNTERSHTIIEHLENSIWKTGKLFYTQSENFFTQGYNFGLKHGHLGIVKTYIDYIQKYGENQQTLFTVERLLQNMIDHLNHDYKVQGIHIYKYYSLYEENENLIKRQNNRLCWCNSDLTFAYFLLKGGILLNNKNFIQLAKKIGTETTKRKSFETTGIESHHFCHGTSGIAFLYDALYKIDNNPEYEKAHNYWLTRTREYLEEELHQEMCETDLSWLFGGKLGALLVLNGMHTENKLFKTLI
ncbi:MULTISPECIES: lanthionine synthetase LanC family protein [unclassified Chryseobacterium]|uniref:lanthionine synthetase LanC family protein n=1 Tax=unclassified Chryseobacterium TaxID=2593645 RepID=UPI000F44EA73|nr:lanthionine synthetase LanC family protein [Chryseobacterium sp. G0240]ROI06418.1 hypothetical protein EGI16_00485 [Chryseobacterium sp. G0240]